MFYSIVKHNDSYPGEKLGPVLYFIASERTFFCFSQSTVGSNSPINLAKCFFVDILSSKKSVRLGQHGVNKLMAS